jgi:DNA-binding NtrC family response regulator
MSFPVIRVLLIDDDEDDYVLTRSLVSEIKGELFQIDWVATYSEALVKIAQKQHDVYLVDYRLGKQSGLDLLQEALALNGDAPFILLTGQGDRSIDIAAMQAGATDYLVKGEMTALILERTIRYAIGYSHTLKTLRLALQEKSQLALALANISTGVVITDPNQPENPVIFVNAAFSELTGYTAAEVIGKNCRFLQGADSDPAVI